MKICSLFSGIGGLELGLEWAGLGETLWQVEQDKYCLEVLAKHWPNAERFNDVRSIGIEDIRGAELLCGGFPCQDISVAGSGAGLAGSRSSLWWEFDRLVGLVLPRVVVIENVSAIVGRGLSEVLCALASRGYASEWDIISAASIGASHRRDRLFIIAHKDDTDSDGGRREVKREPEHQEQQGAPRRELDGLGQERRRTGADNAPDADGGKRGECLQGREAQKRKALNGIRERLGRENAPDTDGGDIWDQSERNEGRRLDVQAGRKAKLVDDGEAGHAPDTGDRERTFSPIAGSDGRPIESRVCPVANGVSRRVAKLRALGNAVVPQVAYQVGLRVQEILREKGPA